MNDQQHRKYIRRWIVCVRTNHWVMRKGRLADNAVLDASEWHVKVCDAARAIAAELHRAITVDDLRRACGVVAFGKAKSSKDLTNGEFDRLLILWGNERLLREGGVAGLLIEPLDLASIAAWNDPVEQRRQSLLRLLLGKAPHELIAHVAANAFQTEFFEDLPIEKIQWLLQEFREGRSLRTATGKQETIEQPY